jgi:hypothetical protein
MSLFRKIRHEVEKVAIATLYFFVAFSIIGTLKMLYLAEYAIDTGAIAKSTLAALVVGKVVVVLNATPFGTRFRSRMLALAIAYRSLLYTAAVGVVVAIERIVHGYMEVGTLGGAWEHALDSANLMRFLANLLGVYLSFLGYNVLTALSRHFGPKRLLRLLFTRGGAVEPPMPDLVDEPAARP